MALGQLDGRSGRATISAALGIICLTAAIAITFP